MDLKSAKSSIHNGLKAESDLWKQRSKIRWLQDGNRNTRFFHQSAESRGSFNRIDKIIVGDTPLVDEGQIRNQAVRYFSNLMETRGTFNHIDRSPFLGDRPLSFC